MLSANPLAAAIKARGTLVVGGTETAPVALLLALGRLARTRLLRWPAAVYTEALRSVPLLLLIYAFLFGLPSAPSAAG